MSGKAFWRTHEFTAALAYLLSDNHTFLDAAQFLEPLVIDKQQQLYSHINEHRIGRISSEKQFNIPKI
jgi:hypothetical protein